MKLIKYIQMFETTLLISLYFTMSCVSLPYGFLPIYNSPQTHRYTVLSGFNSVSYPPVPSSKTSPNSKSSPKSLPFPKPKIIPKSLPKPFIKPKPMTLAMFTPKPSPFPKPKPYPKPYPKPKPKPYPKPKPLAKHNRAPIYKPL